MCSKLYYIASTIGKQLMIIMYPELLHRERCQIVVFCYVNVGNVIVVIISIMLKILPVKIL